ncbi:ABC transporter permease [Zavarzinia compransoris]|uniref:ABC transporter permease n=1 Tax=Zavarzinia marina TaxID=2911065 RepID=UPI001F3F037F|nr:ABC transporter permease [Zavarzinia marina]MCF4165329.1 ABC transporter permease [Zavarzinia marina]
MGLTPAFAVFGVFFALPMAYLLVVTFWRIRRYRLTPDFTFANYQNVYGDYLHALVFTIVIAFVIACITTLLAFAIAYLIRFRSGLFGQVILLSALATLFGGYLVKIYAWKAMLGAQGSVNLLLITLGLIDQPIEWLLYSPTAVILTLVHFMLPFALLPILAGLRGISEAPLEAARDLGAGPWRITKDIVLPQCRTSLFAAFTLSFLIPAGDYVTPRLVGGTETFMVGNFIENLFIGRMNAPMGAALAFSTLLACALVLLFVNWLLKRVFTPKWGH